MNNPAINEPLGGNYRPSLPVCGLIARHFLTNCLIQPRGDFNCLPHRRRQVAVAQGCTGIILISNRKNTQRALVSATAMGVVTLRQAFAANFSIQQSAGHI